MIMRSLNTLPGQDDVEKLKTNKKQIEELNLTVDELKTELAEKTNRIQELCRLSNDYRDDMEHIKSDVCLIILYYKLFILFCNSFFNYYLFFPVV